MTQEAQSLRRSEEEGVTILAFKDASILDTVTIQRIGKELYDAVQGDANKRVVVDFSEVRFLSSQALGVMLTLRRKADKAGVRIALSNIRKELLRIFEITNLSKMFDFFPSRDAAVAALAPK